MDGSDAAKPAPITIKKYANRRLYNTAKSSYVTLDHLAAMVRDGEDFVVFDAKTGEDITRSVLTQIIFEEEAKGESLLPATFLRQIIRLYGDTLQGFVPGYLEASMETFTRNQEKMREQMRVTLGANPALMGFEAMARTNMEWFQRAMTLFSPYAALKGDALKSDALKSDAARGDAAKGDAAKGDAAKVGGAKALAAPADDEIKALKDRLINMQQQLDKIAKGS